MSQLHPALARIAPLWNLDQFVAVNPFVTRTAQPFAAVMADLERETGLAHVPGTSSSPEVVWTQESASVVLGPFLGSYFSPESTLVASPWKGLDLWTAWKASLPWSATLARRPARTLARLVKGLPDTPSEALLALGHTGQNSTELGRLLGLVPGWASALRTREWPAPPSADGPLAALAAMVAALAQVAGVPAAPTSAVPDLSGRLEALSAREQTVQNEVRSQLKPKSRTEPAKVRAAFCIDVRSEPFRRAWEASDPAVETDGFAGFFGLPLDWSDHSGSFHHLPPLLSSVRTLTPPGTRLPRRSILPTSGTPNFPMVELMGWASGWKLLRRRTKPVPALAGVEASLAEVPVSEKAAWGAFILKNLGWTTNWSPVMAFVGHGSTSANNPHAASLDCGACGGRTGEFSARVAAAVLNDPAVRQVLAVQGLQIPPDTWFVGGLHNTTLDSLEWYDTGLPPAVAGLLAGLVHGLERARQAVHAEKKARFAFTRGPAAAGDEAETRPDAALAGNAAFVVAPRDLTRGANLNGRSFLHSYEAALDTDGSVLELILTAPVVVATWINLQYFGSTVTPALYGGGNKVLHSRLGTLGVFEGNDGDLKPGLPSQSVFWNSEAYHEPLRMQVLVVAPLERVSKILDKHPGVAELFDHGWADLSVRDPQGLWHRRMQGAWKAQEGNPG